MNDAQIERLAAKVVEKLLQPDNRAALASAIARELRLLAREYRDELAELGERLDAKQW